MNPLRFAAVAAASLLLSHAPLFAQADAPPILMGGPVVNQGPVVNGGSVTGHVVCDDTQRPARFARIQLTAIRQPGEDTNSQGRQVFRGMFGGNGRTDADGNFKINNVAPGDYYVQASAPGYLTLRQQVIEQVAAGVDPKDILARLPSVHVAANGGASATVTMERGSSVSGTLTWADGTPITGVNVTVQSKSGKGQGQLPAALGSLQFFGGGSFASTDDRGRFRLSGLAPDDWYVVANIDGASPSPTGESTGNLRLYAPGVFRKADATAITVHRGEERDDVRIVLDTTKLHTVSGRVSTPGLSGRLTAFVSLFDPADTSFRVGGLVQPDGTFAVPFVPSGSYTLAINGRVGDPPRRGESNSGDSMQVLQPYQGSVVVTDTDLAGLSATLTARTTQASAGTTAR